MNNYLETIDKAISATHSLYHNNDFYFMTEYESDLQNLLELRSFVEFAFDVEAE